MSAALQSPVLVLNRLWQAVHVCSVERALTLLCTGHAQVVVAMNDGEYRTFSFREWCDFAEADTPAEVQEMPYLIHAPQWGLAFQKLAQKRGATCYIEYPSHPAEKYTDLWDFMVQQLTAPTK